MSIWKWLSGHCPNATFIPHSAVLDIFPIWAVLLRLTGRWRFFYITGEGIALAPAFAVNGAVRSFLSQPAGTLKSPPRFPPSWLSSGVFPKSTLLYNRRSHLSYDTPDVIQLVTDLSRHISSGSVLSYSSDSSALSMVLVICLICGSSF
ncbi:hypothetical protein NYE80_19595 [Paenibacillus sp. FSL H7-0357]|uniref:hypothetical protein n=1 Tax=Paenibacillus sp. FSL H7-0357 TaxID=1536774 RepID=UPI0012E02E03|nr:hypothetical protein [Paenibacillus sp. FSL H7-0357]